jgi:hypothetical protein
MPQSVINRVNFIGRDQPLQAVFTNHSSNVTGDDNSTYNNYDPAIFHNNPPCEILPDVALDNVNITGVDTELHKLYKNLPSPVEITGVDLTQLISKLDGYPILAAR